MTNARLGASTFSHLTSLSCGSPLRAIQPPLFLSRGLPVSILHSFCSTEDYSLHLLYERSNVDNSKPDKHSFVHSLIPSASHVFSLFAVPTFRMVHLSLSSSPLSQMKNVQGSVYTARPTPVPCWSLIECLDQRYSLLLHTSHSVVHSPETHYGSLRGPVMPLSWPLLFAD